MWSPDRQRIAFFRRVPVTSSDADLAWVLHVYAVTRRTGEVRRVTASELGSDADLPVKGGLDWQPLPPRP